MLSANAVPRRTSLLHLSLLEETIVDKKRQHANH